MQGVTEEEKAKDKREDSSKNGCSGSHLWPLWLLPHQLQTEEEAETISGNESHHIWYPFAVKILMVWCVCVSDGGGESEDGLWRVREEGEEIGGGNERGDSGGGGSQGQQGHCFRLRWTL